MEYIDAQKSRYEDRDMRSVHISKTCQRLFVSCLLKKPIALVNNHMLNALLWIIHHKHCMQSGT